MFEFALPSPSTPDRVPGRGHITTLAEIEDVRALRHVEPGACSAAVELIYESTRSGDPALMAEVCQLRGDLLLDRGEYFPALAMFQSAQQRWLAIGDPAGLHRVEIGRASVQLELGEFEMATRTANALVDALTLEVPTIEREDFTIRILAAAHELLGRARIGLGDRQRALHHFDLAADLHQAADDPHGQAVVHLHRGLALQGLGMAHRAFEEIVTAHRMLTAQGAGQLAARCLVSLSELLLDAGQVTRALEVLDEARRAPGEQPHDPVLGRIQLTLAAALLQAGLPADAHAHATQARDVFDRVAMRRESGRTALVRAEASISMGRLDDAIAEFGAAERLFAECEAASWLAQVWLSKAILAKHHGDYTAAVLLGERALAAATECDQPLIVARARLVLTGLVPEPQSSTHLAAASAAAVVHGSPILTVSAGLARAHAHRRAGRQREALTELRRIQHLTRLAEQEDPDPRVRVATRARTVEAGNDLISLLLEIDTERSRTEAWQWSSAMKVGVLDGLVRPAQGWHPGLAELAPSRGDRPARALSELLDPDLLQRGRRARNRAEGTSTDSGLPSVPEGPVLEYHVLGDDVIAFVIREGQVYVRRLHQAAPLTRELVDHWQQDCVLMGASRSTAELTSLASDSRADDVLRQLHLALIEPVLDLLEDVEESLLLVGHRHLHSVPFEALIGVDGRHLGTWLSLCHIPGLSHLAVEAPRPREHGLATLVLAVPDDDAPLVAHEAALVAHLLPETEVYIGDQATAEVLFQRAAAADVVHLACHGTFRYDNPLFSALRLSDRWVTGWEMVESDLADTLVVLSACASGRTSAVDAEPVGLAWATLAAGARGVVGALWAVDDAVTFTFMGAFYENLARGVAPRWALEAARAVVASEHPHPYFWAPFRYFSSPGDALHDALLARLPGRVDGPAELAASMASHAP